MTKEEALQAFFSSFGVEAYPVGTVEAGTMFPYITYTPITSNWKNPLVSLTVQVWYRTSRETPPNEKAKEIMERIGTQGCPLKCDGGRIVLYPGDVIPAPVERDANIKVRQLNITADYQTIN